MKFKFKFKYFNVVLAVAVVAVLIGSSYEILIASQQVHYTGTINAVNVGVYSDSACTIPVTSLNAGALNPGATVTQTLYIKNTGNTPETLTMGVSNWAPSNASLVLSLTWNRQNTVLSVGQVVQATLTLVAAADTGSLTNFGCDVTITGTA